MIDRGRLGADYGVVRLSNGGTPSFKSLKDAAEAGYHGKAVNIEGKGVQKVAFEDTAYNKEMARRSAAASGGGGSGSSSSSGARNVVSSAANTGKGFIETLKSIPGGIVNDISMGFSANPFANRDKQRENLAAKGYTSAQIDDYFARTDATLERMAAENAARGDRDDRGITSLAPATMSAEELARAFAEGRDLTGQTQQSLQPLIVEYLRGRGITNYVDYLPKIFETLQISSAPPVIAPSPVITGPIDQSPAVGGPTGPVDQGLPVTQYPPFAPIQPVGSAGAFMPSPVFPEGGGSSYSGVGGLSGFPQLSLPPLEPSSPPAYGGQAQDQNDPFGLRRGLV